MQQYSHTRFGVQTPLVTLALVGALWTATPARSADPLANSTPPPITTTTNTTPATFAPAAEPAATKQWVWLWRQGCWGFGYRRGDGLWVIDPGSKRLPAAAPAAPQQAQAAAPAQAPAASADPYGFVHWLNATRASFGLPAVGVDPSLSQWAQSNNSQQQSRGLGHYVMGPARRQNSAMGAYSTIGAMWMASPAHRSALLDPSIRSIGIAGLGAYWTFNAN